jgi:hypothetical protein
VPARAIAVLVVALLLPASASASQLIDRDAKNVVLRVNSKGEALITYTAGGKLKHVLAWGAINAIPPTQSRPQVAFKLDYSGGYGKYKRDYWKTFQGSCGGYDGTGLGWLVKACKAPDGSYWALQSWQKQLPNYGVAPKGAMESAWFLDLSHWTQDVPVFDVRTDWAYRSFDHLYGKFTYDASPVFGFKSTPGGNPLDTYGRNVYLDTFNSVYGPGWKRENSFLTHKNTGVFCYGFFSHGPHPSGKGERYRATIIGPGVTPDEFWQAEAPGPYDKALDQQANDEQRSEFADGACKAN